METSRLWRESDVNVALGEIEQRLTECIFRNTAVEDALQRSSFQYIEDFNDSQRIFFSSLANFVIDPGLATLIFGQVLAADNP